MISTTLTEAPEVMFLSPFGDIHLGRQLTYKKDGQELKDKIIPKMPSPSDEYSLINENVKNSDGTYGYWERDISKVKAKYYEIVKNEWEASFKQPLNTPLNFSVQQSKEDLDLWRDGILKEALILATKGEIALTEDETKDINVGNLTGSVFEKIKNKPMTVRDYNNQLHTITIEQAKIISHLQASAIAENFNKKWIKQMSINSAQSLTELDTIIGLNLEG